MIDIDIKKGKKRLTALKQIQENAELAEKKRLGRLQEYKDKKYLIKTVKAWQTRQLTPKVLNTQQRQAIHLLVDFHHNFTDREICARIGVAAQTFISWKNDPIFLRHLDLEISKRRNYMRLHAFRNVNRAIARGDMKSTWKYLEMSGDLKEKYDENRDRTGEMELDDNELQQKIAELQMQLNSGPDPSMS